MLLRTLTIILLFAFGGCSTTARNLNDPKVNHINARLISEAQSIQAGTPFWVAVRLQMDKGWHTYWKNPGDSGLPIRVHWELPDGFKAGPLQWPYPQKLEQLPLTTYGYEHQVLLLAQIQPPDHLKAGTVDDLKAAVHWLACAQVCVPGHADVDLTLPVGRAALPPNPIWTKDFAQTRQNLPVTTSLWNVKGHADHELKLELTSSKPYPLTNVYFFPRRSDLIEHAAPQILRTIEGGYELIIPRSTLFTQPVNHLQGVLVCDQGWNGPGTARALQVDIPLLAKTAKQPHTMETRLNLALMLIFAFIGGLILNLMPCVLPVLSLKILGFVKQSHHHKATLWLHGMVFTAGVLVSFWVLASGLLFLRAAGDQIGWGFQFQSPWFVLFLCIVFIAFALNLFDVFEIPMFVQIAAPKTGPHGSWLNVFLSGVLATASATPCSAPFMGTALGFGLSQPPEVAFAIFTALGLGMSSPYLLFCFFPNLLHFIPKPGPWMVYFKRFLGALLFATAVWLVWVLQIQLSGQGKAGLDKAILNEHSAIAWQPYSKAVLQQRRSQGQIVFVDFTARWCISCQVNERLALENAAVIEKFKQFHVAALKADWTLQDPEISQALMEFGKNSIPLYVIYGKHLNEPIVLPELITPKIVLDALEKANQ